MQTKKSLYRLLILFSYQRIFSFAAFFRCLAVFNLPADAFIFQLVQLRHEVHDPVERIMLMEYFVQSPSLLASTTPASMRIFMW